MLARPGVWFSSPIGPNSDNIIVKTTSGVLTPGIRIGLRRPSIIRASGHTWEWTGYLNYDTALPAFQNNPLEEKFALAKIIDESQGGRVYATGMNEEGNYYIGTTVFDLRSGEQFAIPYKNNLEDTAVSNQVFSNVAIRSTLLLRDNSSVLMGKNTNIFFSGTTRFKSLTTGDITITGSNVPGVYATTTRAGLVQLAKPSDIRGAAGASQGIAKNVVVTAADLATELTTRLSGAVQSGTGIVVEVQSVDPPGGDPNDPTDNISKFVVSVDPVYGGFTPVGGIIMWSGSLEDIPSPNWRLCNGLYGTPDLRDRFIVGAGTGSSYSVGDTGGDALVALDVSELPSHSHGSTTSSNGAHRHFLATDDDADNPGSKEPITETSFMAKAGFGGFDDDDKRRDYVLERPSSSDEPTLANSSLAPLHTHQISAEGGGLPHENRPPYYALAYIMRVA